MPLKFTTAGLLAKADRKLSGYFAFVTALTCSMTSGGEA